MSSGRTMWLAQDAARHRRALMVELQDEFGPVALAVDTVLCSHAKLQNDGGAIREGFAAIAREAGMAGRTDEVRAFMERAAQIGWLDDLDVDPDGRRFRVRVSGWRADQDKAHAAWRQQRHRDRQRGDGSASVTRRYASVTDRDELRCVTKSNLTAQHSTGITPPTPPKGGGRRQRESQQYLAELQAWAAEHFPGVEPGLVRHAIEMLRARGVTPTTEAIYARLGARDTA